jgi:hypothetical protein
VRTPPLFNLQHFGLCLVALLNPRRRRLTSRLARQLSLVAKTFDLALFLAMKERNALSAGSV